MNSPDLKRKLSLDELESLLEEKQEQRSLQGAIHFWKKWRQVLERLIERSFHQKELPGLFQQLLNTYRNLILSPSIEHEEFFLNARADLRSHIFESVWRSSFRRYWETEGELIFTQMSRKSALKWPTEIRKGTHLKLLGLLDSNGKDFLNGDSDVWVEEEQGHPLQETVAGIPFERWIMGVDAPPEHKKPEHQKKETKSNVALNSQASRLETSRTDQVRSEKKTSGDNDMPSVSIPFKPKSLADMMSQPVDDQIEVQPLSKKRDQ